MLQPGLSVEQFIEFSLRRAPAEGLLRYERGAVARQPQLSRAFALRWQALHASARTLEADRMRALCFRHFPERASVWATAGNHALDHGQVADADAYFSRCLELDPSWTAGLAGRAIVCETRKDWAGALVYRERVVQVEQAHDSSTPASLQRTLRYAAALARVERWTDAEVWFRRALALGAFEQLPAERPVLLHVFSHTLYAPALVTQLTAAVTAEPKTEAVQLALAEARRLAVIYRRLETDPALPHLERSLAQGLCLWLAGDCARAYSVLDEAELQLEGDSVLQYLLADCAQCLASQDFISLAAFAVHEASQPKTRDALQQCFSQLSLRRFAGDLTIPEPQPTLADSQSPVLTQLLHVAVFRASAKTRGESALATARASADVLRALAATDL